MIAKSLLASLLVASLAALAQPATKVTRIGFLTPLAASPQPSTLRAFREGMRELGYVEGKTLVLETRYAAGRYDRMPGLISELLAQQVDVLVVGSDIGVLAAKTATATVPIVFAGVTDPVGGGIVSNLARPGGNVTGVTFGIGGVGFGGKWVELLREAVPRISHIAAISSAANPATAPLLREVEAAGRRLKIKVDSYDARDERGLDRALASIAASPAQGLIVTTGPLFVVNRTKIVQFAARKRLPAVYFFKLFPEAGGLMSYGGSLEESYRRAASHVDKVLKGAKPADLPIEQPTRMELVVNLKAARALKLALPASIVARADQVIQ
jgi:putative tryptophan/tyrosine transport system substrate-binding protein